MQDTFQWTDELVYEFVNQLCDGNVVGHHLQQFKSSKSPKKEWEIVAFGEHFDNRICLYKLQENGLYRNEDDDCTIEYGAHQFKNNNEFIHSVRRLSDASVWSVDEKADTAPGYAISTEVITGFCIGANGEMRAQFGDVSVPISLLKKPPQAILTTVDGVARLNGEAIFIVGKDFQHYAEPDAANEFTKGYYSSQYIFSTKEAADKFIAENKPLLSLNDVKYVLDSIQFDKATTKEFIIEVLTTAVKQKLNQ